MEVRHLTIDGYGSGYGYGYGYGDGYGYGRKDDNGLELLEACE